MARKHFAESYGEALLRIIAKYRAAHGHAPFSMHAVAVWAIGRGLWRPPRRDPSRELAKHLSKTASKKHHCDAQGRQVRTLVPARIEKTLPGGQKVFEIMWDLLDTMNDDHAQANFAARFDKFVGIGTSLRNDMSSYYDNNPNAKGRIQLSLNLDDLLEPPILAEHTLVDSTTTESVQTNG